MTSHLLAQEHVAKVAVANLLALRATGKFLADLSDWAQGRYLEDAQRLLAPAPLQRLNQGRRAGAAAVAG